MQPSNGHAPSSTYGNFGIASACASRLNENNKISDDLINMDIAESSLHITLPTQASVSVAYTSPAHAVRGVLGLVNCVHIISFLAMGWRLCI